MVMKQIICFIYLFSLCLSTQAQAKNDYNWVLGYTPNLPGECFGGTILDFNSNSLEPKYFNTKCNAGQPAILSSESGKLLAYSEGCRIYNSEHEIMENGDSIAFGRIWESYCPENGYPGVQDHIFLPFPGDSNQAVLLYLKVSDNYELSSLFYSIISFKVPHTLGIVIEKDLQLIDTEITGHLSATKHANGRDWWVLLPEKGTNRFFTLLVSPKGVTVKDTQAIGDAVLENTFTGQTVFSPDGKNYIRFEPYNGIDIFDFDRCYGTLFNNRESGPLTDPPVLGGGVACSVDSRYLYVSNNTEFFQYDMFADSIFISKQLIGTYDGYKDPFSTTFYHMLLAPDEKIYMFSTNGVKSIHVVNNPTKEGSECSLVQHSIKLPSYAKIGSPTLPFFRLGPEDGSPCDTLGIDNVPVAHFNYTVDSTNHFKIHVRNLSYFNPETHHWTYGNGETSELEDPPAFDYADMGIYNLCLTVSNEYGTDTYCQQVSIDSTTSVGFLSNDPLYVYPNPFTAEIVINGGYLNSHSIFKLFSLDGKLVASCKIKSNNHQFVLPDLSHGMYLYTISEKEQIVHSGKLIK